MRHGSGGHIYKPKFRAKGDPEDRKLWTGKGCWRIRLAWKDSTTGRRQTLDEKVPVPANKSAASDKDARVYLRERIAADTGRTLATTIKAEDLRYENMRTDLLDYYQEQKKKTLLTGRDGKTYISSMNHLDNFFWGDTEEKRVAGASWSVLSITFEALKQFKKARRASGASDTSIARSLELLRCMFYRAVDSKEILLNDMPKFEMPLKAKARKGMLESKDYAALRAALSERLRPVLALGFHSGMRLGEIRRLRWESVDLDEGVLHLEAEETKNGTARDVPIPAELIEWLKITRLKYPEAVYVFGGAKPLGTFRKRWTKACAVAGVPGLRFHDLRRGAVTRLADSKVPVDVAMAITGHVSVAAWKGYIQKQNPKLIAAMRKTEATHEEAMAQAKSAQSNVEEAAKPATRPN